jgi:pyrrolidone-carboxylate peptidase
MSPQLLIYAFEAFGKYPDNITEQLVKQLPPHPQVETRVLPVRFEARLFSDLLTRRPGYILGLGQCPRGQRLRIERRAWNGQRAERGAPIVPITAAGAAAYPVTWALPKVSGLTRTTYDAGRYVCNFSMYTLLQRQASYAFLHIPRGFPQEQALAYLQTCIRQVTG